MGLEPISLSTFQVYSTDCDYYRTEKGEGVWEKSFEVKLPDPINEHGELVEGDVFVLCTCRITATGTEKLEKINALVNEYFSLYEAYFDVYSEKRGKVGFCCLKLRGIESRFGEFEAVRKWTHHSL